MDIEYANERVGTEPALFVVDLPLRERPEGDAEVQAAGVELIEQPISGLLTQSDAGCVLVEVGK